MHAIGRRPLLAGLVLVLLLLVLFFGGRAAWRLGNRLLGEPPPRQTNVSQIADWMSVPYIARAYRVPRSELFQALGVDGEGRERRSIRELAQDNGRSSDELLGIVRETVLAWQATHAEPTGPPGRPTTDPQKPDLQQPDSEKPTGLRPPRLSPPGLSPPGGVRG